MSNLRVTSRLQRLLVLRRPSKPPKVMIEASEMKSFLSFFGLSRSYSSSGKSTEELKQKANEKPKEMTNSEWKDLLDGQTFHVTREAGTERPWSSCLNDEKRNGTFICACCKNPLFASSTVKIPKISYIKIQNFPL